MFNRHTYYVPFMQHATSAPTPCRPLVTIATRTDACTPLRRPDDTAKFPTNIVDFRRFDSSIISILRGGISRLAEDFPESLSQAMLVGIMLVGRLGVRLPFFLLSAAAWA